MIRRIIHFSDIHSNGKSILPQLDSEKIAKAIFTLEEADTYSIVVSGDIASSGKKQNI